MHGFVSIRNYFLEGKSMIISKVIRGNSVPEACDQGWCWPGSPASL